MGLFALVKEIVPWGSEGNTGGSIVSTVDCMRGGPVLGAAIALWEMKQDQCV